MTTHVTLINMYMISNVQTFNYAYTRLYIVTRMSYNEL